MQPSVTDVSFKSDLDGTEQRYVRMLPEGFAPDAPHDVLVVLHGHGSDRWQFVRDGRDECRAARDVAAERATIFISPDYRAPTSWMGPAAEADLVQIIREVRSRFTVGRVFLCGGSMGGAACLTFGVLHPEMLDGIAAMNGMANFVEYANFPDAISTSFGGSKEDAPEEYRKRSAEFFPDKLTMPVGLTVSGRDTVVPPDSVRRLYQALKAAHRAALMIDRPEAGHCTDYADARAIIEFVIRKAPLSAATPETRRSNTASHPTSGETPASPPHD